ncbi:MAG: aspartate dehydrogenase, partial [Stellaceae bacterium]
GTHIARVLELPDRAAAARERLGAVTVVDTLTALLEPAPDLVVEVAGHGALSTHGTAVLEAGIDLLAVSIGALADAELMDRLLAAAKRSGAQLLLAPGAVGGIDALAAMRLRGLARVRYRGVKPPIAWRGTPAERLLDLARLAQRTSFYQGNAREAALAYPQNANVAATIALAGLGFEATEVELVADPEAPGNRHEIEAEGATGRFRIVLDGRPSEANPKTSALAALSVARVILNRSAAISI